MNVYFCDVCGVRVTDLDLHSGHGMRRRNDVICAACLELGHGKGWVANHAQKQQMAFAGAATTAGSAPVAPTTPDADAADDEDMDAGAGDDHDHPAELALLDQAAAAPPAPPELEHEDDTSRRAHLGRMPTPPPALDMARDRLRTLDDDQPPSRVAAIQLEPEADGADLPLPSALGEPTVDDTAKVAVLHQELSTAAAGFAALTPPVQDHPAAADDLDEEPVPQIDDSGAQAELETSPEEGANAEKAETASNMPITEVPSAASRAKAAPSSNRTPRARTNASPSASRNASAASSASSGSSASATSSRSSKVSKSSKSTKSSKSRTARKSKPGLPPLMVMTMIGVGGILLIGSIAIGQKLMAPKPVQQTIEVKLGEQLQDAIKDARATVTTALDNPTIDGLEAAKAKIHAAQDLATQFSTEAQKGTNGAKVWTEDDVDRQMETWGFSDLNSLMKNINDKEDILKGNESH